MGDGLAWEVLAVLREAIDREGWLVMGAAAIALGLGARLAMSLVRTVLLTVLVAAVTSWITGWPVLDRLFALLRALWAAILR